MQLSPNYFAASLAALASASILSAPRLINSVAKYRPHCSAAVSSRCGKISANTAAKFTLLLHFLARGSSLPSMSAPSAKETVLEPFNFCFPSMDQTPPTKETLLSSTFVSTATGTLQPPSGNKNLIHFLKRIY